MRKIYTFFLFILTLTFALPVTASSLPAAYDLREEGRISPTIKDQGVFSNCWAFATLASLESNLITKGLATNTIDLSEAHLVYFNKHGASKDTTSKYAGKDTFGGSETANYYNSMATLSRGYGPVAESAMPYSVLSQNPMDSKYSSESLMTNSDYELTDAECILADLSEDSYDENAVNAVKELIMEEGAVASSIEFPDISIWDKVFGTFAVPECKSFYCKEEDSSYSAGHAVTIIGWDDNYNDFASAKVEGGNVPPGPGAWIIKDSFGSELHGDGYFYASYYSSCFSSFFSFQARKNTGREAYQYDGTGCADTLMTVDDQVSGANLYTARTDLLIDQLATMSPQAGSQTNYQIYINIEGNNPVSGTKVLDKTFTIGHRGYSRIDIGTSIAIPKGCRFSLVVTTKTSDNKYFVPFELADVDGALAFPAVTRPGMSSIKITGKRAGEYSGQWQDIDRSSSISDDDDYKYRIYNAIAKAFGNKGGTKAQKIKTASRRTMKKGRKIKLQAKLTKGRGKLLYAVSDPSKASVNSKGLVKAKKKGKVKITIWASPTGVYKSAKKVVTVTIK